MMILRSSSTSPFVRKVIIAAKLLGLFDQITLQEAKLIDPTDSLSQQNPLGKIPALILEGGEAVFDSSVIVDTLDLMAGGGKLIPADPVRRRQVLTLQALCDGLLDASVLLVAEQRFRLEAQRSAKWVAHQTAKVDRAFGALEAMVPQLQGGPDVGQIALACALSYRDLRFPDQDWRAIYPQLALWLAAFEKAVPAFAETAFKQ
nr:glutathione S-transferase family protein [uncultured Cohaesibacter sp.]